MNKWAERPRKVTRRGPESVTYTGDSCHRFLPHCRRWAIKYFATTRGSYWSRRTFLETAGNATYNRVVSRPVCNEPLKRSRWTGFRLYVFHISIVFPAARKSNRKCERLAIRNLARIMYIFSSLFFCVHITAIYSFAILRSQNVITSDIFAKSILRKANMDTFVQQLNQFLQVTLVHSTGWEEPWASPAPAALVHWFLLAFLRDEGREERPSCAHFVPHARQSYILSASGKSNKNGSGKEN